MQTIRTFETADHKYYIGYGRTAKTTYEQQQERKAERIKVIQKALFILAIILFSTVFSFILPEATFYMLLVCLLGIAAVATDSIALFN